MIKALGDNPDVSRQVSDILRTIDSEADSN